MMHTIPYGTSEPQDFALFDNGIALVGTGFSVALTITTASGAVLGSPAPTVAWLSQADGTVRVSDVQTLPVGSYSVRFQLEDLAGSIGYAPNGDSADTWDVVSAVP